MVKDLGKILFKSSETELFKATSISDQKVGKELILSRPVSDFDYLYIQYETDSGGNFPTQIIRVNSMITKRVTMDSFNIPDSNPDGVYLYEFTMLLSGDNRKFTIEKSNGVKIFSSNENIPNVDVGIRGIYGIKIGGN